MAKRIVKVSLWRYRDTEGNRRIARFGDEVDIPKAEIDRGDTAGVFTPAPVPAVQSSALERALTGITQRTPEPPEPEGEAALHHDVTTPTEPTEPDADAAEQTPTSTPAAEPTDAAPAEPAPESLPERPANAATVDVWREYVAALRPDLAAEVGSMSKDDLKAVVPKGS